MWTQLLGTPSIGVHDNYFELGGDSIIVIQMVARLAQEGYIIQPRDVFEKQTISQLAHAMKKQMYLCLMINHLLREMHVCFQSNLGSLSNR